MVRQVLMPSCLALLTSCAVPISLNSIGPGGGQKLVIGEQFSLQSELLDEARPYWVYLPRSYDRAATPERYPVVYLLDARPNFQSTTGIINHLGPWNIPDLIVVGIPNTNRNRDLFPTHSTVGPFGEEHAFLEDSGGGDAFLKFIKDELAPEVDATFRTTDERILVGHSAGGLLALHALVNGPEFFDSYIAIDPTLYWDDQQLVRQARAAFASGQAPQASVFITIANNLDNDEDYRAHGDPSAEATREMVEIVEAVESSEFRVEMRYFENEDHGSVPLLSVYHGLRFLYDDYDYTPPAPPH